MRRRWLAVVIAVAGCRGGAEGPAAASAPGSEGQPLRVKLDLGERSDESLPVRVELHSSAPHMAYRTEIDVRPADKLIVVPAGGGVPVEHVEPPISAEYYHAGQLLVVESGDVRAYYVAPLRWTTAPR